MQEWPGEHRIAIVVLAAGRGQRMGGHRPKLLMPWHDGRPLIWHTVHNALELRPYRLVVVLRPDLPALAEALRDLPVICVTNYRFEEGMGTSLAAGIRAVERQGDVQAALVMLGDEPFVDPGIVGALMAAYIRSHMPITVPFYGDQPGPPTLFDRQMFPDLRRLRGDSGGRQLIARYPQLVCRVPLSEEQRPPDIDTPEDYLTVLDKVLPAQQQTGREETNHRGDEIRG